MKSFVAVIPIDNFNFISINAVMCVRRNTVYGTWDKALWWKRLTLSNTTSYQQCWKSSPTLPYPSLTRDSRILHGCWQSDRVANPFCILVAACFIWARYLRCFLMMLMNLFDVVSSSISSPGQLAINFRICSLCLGGSAATQTLHSNEVLIGALACQNVASYHHPGLGSLLECSQAAQRDSCLPSPYSAGSESW